MKRLYLHLFIVFLLSSYTEIAFSKITDMPSSGGGGGVADNLGDHTMTESLRAGGFSIDNSSSVKVGTHTRIDNDGLYIYGDIHAFADGASTVPITAKRPNTEGRFLTMRGDIYDYGSLNLVSGGFFLSTGTDSDTIGTYAKWFGIGLYPPSAKLHVSQGIGQSIFPLMIVSTGIGPVSSPIFEVDSSSVQTKVPFYSSGAVTASSYKVNRDSIFYSTFQAGRYEGYVTIVGSITALAAGASFTFTPPGFSVVEMPILTELSAGGAEANQVILTAITATGFTMKNVSGTEAKDVYFWALGRR